MSVFWYYVIIVNIIGFILFAVNTWLYTYTAEGQIDKLLTIATLLGGSLGILISMLIFDRKAEKGNMMSRVFMPDKTNNTIKQIGLLGAIFAVILILIILLPNSQFLFDKREKEIHIDIKLEGIHSIVANVGRGPKKLNYGDHQETVNRFISTIEGEYRYVRLLRTNRKTSGGGPHAVGFYYQDCKYVLQYTDGYLAVPTSRQGYYYLYTKNGIAPLFDEFEVYLNNNGQYYLPN